MHFDQNTIPMFLEKQLEDGGLSKNFGIVKTSV